MGAIPASSVFSTGYSSAKLHDPERLKAAIAKRERKAAKKAAELNLQAQRHAR